MLRAALALLIVTGISSAQDEDPIQFSLKPAGPLKQLTAGSSFTLNLTARINPGWHIYSTTQASGGPTPTNIAIAEGQGLRLAGPVEEPTPQIQFDPNFNTDTAFFEDQVVFKLPVEVMPAAPPGQARLTVAVMYQVCNDRICLPAKVVKVSTPVTIAAATQPAPAPPGPAPAQAPAAETKLPSASSSLTARAAPPPPPTPANPSMLSFIWLAMSVGALSLLTPCVFPMVPITVSYFTKHAAGRRSTAVRDAGIYALGIILTFTALGVALAVVFGAAGINRFAASPWINLAITAIFVGFALSLFGAFEIGLPSGFVNRLDQIARGRESSKVVGLLLMGLTFSLTSFTCTAPFVGTLLVMASQGRWTQPVIGMLAFSSVFAFPFFLLALAPQLVSQLPKSGGWLNSVKVVMGLLEIAAAMKFLSNADLIWRWGIFTRGVVLAVWISIGVLTVLYILGYFKLAHDSALEHVSALRLMTAMAFLAVTVALVPGLFGQPLGELDSFLPPSASELATPTGSRAAADGTRWILNDLAGAREQARREQKLVFVDFTGYTCTNCRWMEANMFPRPEVRGELDKFVTVRLYTDGTGQLYQDQQKLQQSMFGTVALPLYAILRPDGTQIATFPGLTRNATEFVTFLRRAVSPDKAT